MINLRLEKSIAFAGLFLALLILIAVGVATSRSMHKLIESDTREDRAYDIIIKTQALFSNIKDAETERRGYVFTGQKNHLKLYSQSLESVEQMIDELRKIVSDRAILQKMLEELDILIEVKLDLLKQSVEARKRGYDAEQQIAWTERGSVAMDQIRALVGQLREEEAKILKEWRAENERTTKHTIGAFAAGVAIGFALLFAVFVLLLRDITTRIKTENEVREALKVKSDFTSMVSHELRTPLTAIKEGIAMVVEGDAGPLNEEQAELLQLSKRNVDRLSRLIHDILSFQKLESKKMDYDFRE